MSLKLDYKKAKSKEEAYKKIKKEITPKLLAKYNVDADIIYDDENCSIRAKGDSFSFDLDCYDDGIRGDLSLGFLLRPFKGKVLESLEKKLKRIV